MKKTIFSIFMMALAVAVPSNAETISEGNIEVKSETTKTYEGQNTYFEGKTTVTIEKNGTLKAGLIDIEESVSITNHGTLDIDRLWMQGGTVTNYGTITDNESYGELGVLNVSAENAVFTNYGVIDGATTVDGGGVLYAKEGSQYGEMNVLGGGTLVVEGLISLSDSLYGPGEDDVASIIFTENGVIDMNDNVVWIDDQVSITLKVDYMVDEYTTIQKDSFFINYTVGGGFDDSELEVLVVGADGTSTTRTIGQLTIPEPTTSTLGLLALIGVVLRRRR